MMTLFTNKIRTARTERSAHKTPTVDSNQISHLFGDLKLFEPKAMCPLIAVRDREER
jgi:hypothetical protein